MEITVELLCELFHYRWSAPVLAELWRGRGCKYVTLRTRLTVADVPLRQALDFLMAKGWAMRNPGYGHPSRPEYILTDTGRLLAVRCATTLSALAGAGALKVGLNKWTLPLVLAMSLGPSRFGGLKHRIPGITPRALAQALRDAIEAGLADRRVTDEMPVEILYLLTPLGEQIAAIWR